MKKREWVFIDQQFKNDVFLIEEEAQENDDIDAFVMIALLSHIMARRRHNGKYLGWADVPIGNMAKHYHVGYRRIKAALDRLVEWGMIKESPTNNSAKLRRNALWYRYDTRDYKALPEAEEEEEVEEEEEEVYEEAKVSVVAPKPAKLKSSDDYPISAQFFMRRHHISPSTYENLTDEQKRSMNRSIGWNDIDAI